MAAKGTDLKVIWIIEAIGPLISEFKGDKAITATSKALRLLVEMGLNANPEAQYGRELKASGYAIENMDRKNVRITKELDTKVRSYCGRQDLTIYQGYFDLICYGLLAHGVADGTGIVIPPIAAS